MLIKIRAAGRFRSARRLRKIRCESAAALKAAGFLGVEGLLANALSGRAAAAETDQTCPPPLR